MSTPTTQLLAGAFPPGLNTAAPSTDLTPAETPDSYGFSLTADGKIKKGVTIPTGTSRVQRSFTISDGTSDIPFLWHGRRLWNITNLTASTASNLLRMGALDYDDVYYPPSSRNDRLAFAEDANTILAILPIEPDSMMVCKASGSYVIRNISDTRGFFQTSDLLQAMRLDAATYAVVLNNVAYVGNSDGVVGYENFHVTEASRKIRPDRATVGALAMTADFERQWLILGSTYVYDAAADKWFRYDGSTFRFTSRRVRNPNWEPFSVDRLTFMVEHGDTTNGILKYQLRHDKDTWSNEYTVRLPYSAEKYVTISEDVASGQNYTSSKWQMRITDLSANKYLREIHMQTENLEQDDFGE